MMSHSSSLQAEDAGLSVIAWGAVELHWVALASTSAVAIASRERCPR